MIHEFPEILWKAIVLTGMRHRYTTASHARNNEDLERQQAALLEKEKLAKLQSKRIWKMHPKKNITSLSYLARYKSDDPSICTKKKKGVATQLRRMTSDAQKYRYT
jgi:Co/Zn/Cd efflux system component